MKIGVLRLYSACAVSSIIRKKFAVEMPRTQMFDLL